MKKYQLGALAVSDKELQETKQEIIEELIDRMQKYVADGKTLFEDHSKTKEERLQGIEYYCGRFCGLSEFLNITMGVEMRCADGMPYTQVMFNKFFSWKQNLEIEIKREREAARDEKAVS